MDARQLLLEIRRVMRALTWDRVGSTKIFGTGGDQFWVSHEAPKAMLDAANGNTSGVYGHAWLGPEKRDAEDPEIVDQEVLIRLVALQAETSADPYRERALVGRWSATAVGGITDVEREVDDAIGSLGRSNGVRVRSIATGADPSRAFPRGTSRIARYSARVNKSPGYPAQRSLAATGGSGQIACTWSLAAVNTSRADYVGQKLEWGTGTAPSAPGSGTDVAISTTATSKTITGLTAGAKWVALWATYDDDFPVDGTYDSYSTAQTATATVT